jgi:hypothetical protein
MNIAATGLMRMEGTAWRNAGFSPFAGADQVRLYGLKPALRVDDTALLETTGNV